MKDIQDLLENKFHFVIVCFCVTTIAVSLIFGLARSCESDAKYRMHRAEWNSKSSSDFWKYNQIPPKDSAEKGSPPEKSETP